jgi:hypothetical protein
MWQDDGELSHELDSAPALPRQAALLKRAISSSGRILDLANVRRMVSSPLPDAVLDRHRPSVPG